MMLLPRRASFTSSRPGLWLACLAVTIQLLLPFVVAYEVAFAGAPAEVAVICSASGAQTRNPDGGARHHHGLSDGCPICAAMAAGQGFTTPAPLAVPLPRAVAMDRAIVSSPALESLPAVSPYQSRAPPALV